jgi:hypothetical protein
MLFLELGAADDRCIGTAGWRSLTGPIGQDLHVSRCNRARSKFNQPILLVTNISKRRRKMFALPHFYSSPSLQDGIANRRGSRLTLVWATMSNNLKTCKLSNFLYPLFLLLLEDVYKAVDSLSRAFIFSSATHVKERSLPKPPNGNLTRPFARSHG